MMCFSLTAVWLGISSLAESRQAMYFYNSHAKHGFGKIMSGASQSIVDQLTNRALYNAKTREKDAETFVKKYMKVALSLFVEEISHTTKFEKVLDLICSMESDMCHFAKTRDKMLLTRIGGDDKRNSLTIGHLQQLMRISQQGPELPAISNITWPFALCETGSWNNQEFLINRFIDKVYRKLLDSPRRIV
ncbi:hypothetical protein LOD99_12148 [Oopsacas minuta]|uniref:Uncharacterized protein n=1 Tax=Oopsacas minuta TaxID=111878 RepID=A0AAV7JIS4_9METZ|nr:hypothetical protein LOD99_12148 [Oopsacas minuta]